MPQTGPYKCHSKLQKKSSEKTAQLGPPPCLVQIHFFGAPRPSPPFLVLLLSRGQPTTQQKTNQGRGLKGWQDRHTLSAQKPGQSLNGSTKHFPLNHRNTSEDGPAAAPVTQGPPCCPWQEPCSFATEGGLRG